MTTAVHFYSGPLHGQTLEVADKIMKVGVLWAPFNPKTPAVAEYDRPDHPMLSVPFEYRISRLEWPESTALGHGSRAVGHSRHVRLVIAHIVCGVSDEEPIDLALTVLREKWNHWLKSIEAAELTMFPGFELEQELHRHEPLAVVQYTWAQMVLIPVEMGNTEEPPGFFTAPEEGEPS